MIYDIDKDIDKDKTMRLRNYFKIFVLFFIFYKGYCDKHHHRHISLFNRSICKSLTGLGSLTGLVSLTGLGSLTGLEGTGTISRLCGTPFTRRLLYYGCSHRMRRHHNPYSVFAKDIIRKYVYIVNVVVIYIILYSL